MKPTVKMVCLTLLGLLLPLGGIWGPYLVKIKNEKERKFRSRLIAAEVVIWLVSMVPLVIFWWNYTQEITTSGKVELGPPAWLFTYPVLLVVLACALLVAQTRHRE